MALFHTIKKRRQLKAFRKNVNTGDPVYVNDGKRSFKARIIHKHDGYVTVMNSHLEKSSYGIRCIYPIPTA